MKLSLLATALLSALPLTAFAQPDTIAAMGQKFAEPKNAKMLRVLLVGSGSSHDFPQYFLGTDAETLKATGTMDVAATPNLDEAMTLLPQSDVIVFSGNHDQFASEAFQKALNTYADKRKGVIILHAGTWDHPAWKDFNDRFVGGKTPSHGVGEFEVKVKGKAHPIMKGVPDTFKITDENYRFEPKSKVKCEILAENAPDGGKDPLPSVWSVRDSKTRIVGITLGHAKEAHDNPAYRSILTNAVNWVAGR
jgi:uncharacterized protein